MIKEFNCIDHRHVEASRLERFFEHTGIWKLHFGNHANRHLQEHRPHQRKRTVLLTKYSNFLTTLSISQLEHSYKLIKLDTEGRIGPFELSPENVIMSASINRPLLHKLCVGESGLSLNFHLLMKIDMLLSRSKAAQNKYEETTIECLKHFSFRNQLNRDLNAREVLHEFSLIKSVNLMKTFTEIKKGSLSAEIKAMSSQHQIKLKNVIAEDLKRVDKRVSELLNLVALDDNNSNVNAQTSIRKKHAATIKSYILLISNIKKCLGDQLEDITNTIEINLMAIRQCSTTCDPFKSHHENAVENILCHLTQYASLIKRFPFSQNTTKAKPSVSFKEKSLTPYDGLTPIEIATQILTEQPHAQQREALLMKVFANFEMEYQCAPENDRCFHIEVKKVLLYQLLKNKATRALKSCLSIKKTILSAQEHFIKGQRLPEEIFKLIRHLCFGLSELLNQYPSEVKELYVSKNETAEYTFTKAMNESYCRRSTASTLTQCERGKFSRHLSAALMNLIDICQVHLRGVSNWTNLEKWVRAQCSKRVTLLSLVNSSRIMTKLLNNPFYKYQRNQRLRLVELSKISASIATGLT